MIPPHDVRVSVKTESNVREISAVPRGEELAFEGRAGRVEFTVPKLNGHQMIALNFG